MAESSGIQLIDRAEGFADRTAVVDSNGEHTYGDLLGWSVVYELIVDRNQGKTIHHQWSQPPESVAIVGAYIHGINILNARDKGFGGWFRFHTSWLECLVYNIKHTHIEIKPCHRTVCVVSGF